MPNPNPVKRKLKTRRCLRCSYMFQTHPDRFWFICHNCHERAQSAEAMALKYYPTPSLDNELDFGIFGKVTKI